MSNELKIKSVFLDERLKARATAKALLIVYNNQTNDEKLKDRTEEHNNMGFSAQDAKYGSYCARYFLRNKHLTKKMVYIWTKVNCKGNTRIGKYWRQLS